MYRALPSDEDLLHRLPLPLAQLGRRAHNAKTPLERHQAAYYLWEAALKLLASVAVIEYAQRPEHEPALAERLQNLARPAVGHWWEFVRLLVPVLAREGDPAFQSVQDLLLGRPRDDLPRTAGLDAALAEALDGRGGARSTVRPGDLFDRLVRYRNREVGHGAAGQRPPEFYDRLGGALLAGLLELLGRLDVLARRRLVYLADVRRLPSGRWLVERYELAGETARRLESLDLPDAEAVRSWLPQRLYLEPLQAGPAEGPAAPVPATLLQPLHPLAVYDPETGEMLFLNARRGRRRTEYLCYSSGRVLDRPDEGGEQRALLARILGLTVDDRQVEQWTARSQAEEAASGPAVEEPNGPLPWRVGEFEVLSKLGEGGMGVVYRAWQPSLGRQVALKCLFRSGDPRAEARFAREIRALGRVDHPHLVKIFTSGAEGEQWFYAMELVEGATLAAVCDRLPKESSGAAALDLDTWQKTVHTVCEECRRAEKPLSQPRPEGQPPTATPPPFPRSLPPSGRGYLRHVVELVRQVAEAAHALHEAGIVHRDVKPGNIMVSAEGDRAFLMDLGLAQLTDEVQGRLTLTRQFVGTLRYASPEQVLAVGGLDRRSDVYSLGSTLWELLALRPVYGATDQTPTPELMRRIQYEDPQRLRAHHPGIPADLEAIVERCLQKDARRRYATALELADDLRRFLNGAPVQARPVGAWERAIKWVKRRPAAAALLALGLLALVSALGTALWYFRAREQQQVAEEMRGLRDLAEQQRDEADRQRGLARERQQTAEDRSREADRQRALAEDQRALARRYLYLARMNLAQREWRQANVPRVLSLLREFAPEQTGQTGPEDLRGFEWDYLLRLCHCDLWTFRGHTAQVAAVAFHPAGKRVASAGWDGTVKLWDLETGREVLSLGSGGAQVLGVAFRPDGGRLAAAGKDGVLKVWDTETGKEVLTLRGHAPALTSVAFSPDGKRLAATGGDPRHLDQPGEVMVWDADTGAEVLTVKGTVHLNAVAFSPDSKRLAAAGVGGSVTVWEAASAREVFTLRANAEPLAAVTFSPDGTRLASAGFDNTVRLWDATTGREVLALKGHTDAVLGVAFSPDGSRLASASLDETVRVWDAAGGEEVLNLRGHTDGVTGLAFRPDGSRLASASLDHTVKVWDATASQEAFPLLGHASLVNAVAFGPDGSRLASAGQDGKIAVWDVPSGQERFTVKGNGRPVNCLAFHPDGRRLAFGGDRTVRLWDMTGGKDVTVLPGHTETVQRVAFSPDGKRLASASGNEKDLDRPGEVKVWDAASGKELLSLKGHRNAVLGLAFAPDGRRLASADWNGDVKVWDAESGKGLLSFKGHLAPVLAAAFAPDGKRLATAGGDKAVKVWDADTGREVFTLEGHTREVLNVAFSPDGKRLASAGRDRTIRVWDAATGQEILSLPGHTDYVTGVVFSPDGHLLASASWDRTVRLWEAREPDQARAAHRNRLDSGLMAWHSREAASSQGARRWFAAAFHLGRLIDAQPTDPWRHAFRGSARAEMAQWAGAADDFSQAATLKPEVAGFWYARALVQLARGDSKGYRQTCKEMVDRFGSSANPAECALAAYTPCVAPGGGVDPARLVPLAEKATQASPHVAEGALGIALYRAGRFEPAVEHLNAALEAAGPKEKAGIRLFLAMAHQRLGHAREARRALEEAVREIDRDGAAAGEPGFSWDARVALALVRREAEALLKPAGGKPVGGPAVSAGPAVNGGPTRGAGAP